MPKLSSKPRSIFTSHLINELNPQVFAPGCVICKDCDIEGEVHIGSHTVIHPKAKIIASGGPIVIGENNLIEEQVVIKNDSAPGDSQSMVIGDSNVFEIGCIVNSLKIGDNNVFESKAKTGKFTTFTSGCVVGPKCVVSSNEVIPENTVIYGDGHRRIQAEKPPPQTLQLDFLKKILPNYHYLKKTSQKLEH